MNRLWMTCIMLMPHVPASDPGSWYSKTEGRLAHLENESQHHLRMLTAIEATLERMERRMDNHGNRLATIAAVGIVSAVLASGLPDWISTFRQNVPPVKVTMTQ